MIVLAWRFKFVFPIPPINEVKLVFLIFVKIALLYKLIYYFIIDNKSIYIIDKAENII